LKLTRRRRLHWTLADIWHALMYNDPREWGILRYVAWALPVVVAIIVRVVWIHGR